MKERDWVLVVGGRLIRTRLCYIIHTGSACGGFVDQF